MLWNKLFWLVGGADCDDDGPIKVDDRGFGFSDKGVSFLLDDDRVFLAGESGTYWGVSSNFTFVFFGLVFFFGFLLVLDALLAGVVWRERDFKDFTMVVVIFVC